jgi:hypothetical protein
MKTRLAAAAAALLFSSAIVAPAVAQSYTADFTTLADATVVTDQFQGLTFSLTGGEAGAGAPLASTRWAGVMELNNSPSGDYPTSTLLTAAFGRNASAISFSYNNYGTGDAGHRGDSFYTAYDALGRVVTTGSLNGLDYGSGPVTVLGKNIRSLVFSNNAGADSSWEFGMRDMSYTLSAAGVPEPATWALMIMGFGAVGGAMRRRQSVAVKVRFA